MFRTPNVLVRIRFREPVPLVTFNDLALDLNPSNFLSAGG
jgi:hypothetical protein